MENQNCVLCGGEGFYATANGEDDEELTYCVCEAGKLAEFDGVLVWSCGADRGQQDC